MDPNDPLKDLLPPVTREDLRMISSDLSELQEVVNRGDYVVLAGGGVLAWWGLSLGLGSFWNVLILLRAVPPFPAPLLELVFGWIGASIIARVMKTDKVLRPWRNQAVSTAWWSLMVVLPIFIFGCYARGVTNLFVMSGFECLIFAMATAFTAMASLRRWLLYFAAGWIVAAIAILFFVNSIGRAVVFSIACLALLTVPGVHLVLEFRRARR